MASYTDVAGARGAVVVVASDSTVIPATRAILVGVAGTVTADFASRGSNIACILPAGIHALQVTRIYSTGTTATSMVALY